LLVSSSPRVRIAREVVCLKRGIAQTLYRIAAFGDRRRCLLDCAVELLLRFRGPFAQQLGDGLQAQQQAVKALQQSVVEIPCNACALAHTCVKRQLEVMAQLRDPPVIDCLQHRQQEQRAHGPEPRV
jgi:hypothetical protein